MGRWKLKKPNPGNNPLLPPCLMLFLRQHSSCLLVGVLWWCFGFIGGLGGFFALLAGPKKYSAANTTSRTLLFFLLGSLIASLWHFTQHIPRSPLKQFPQVSRHRTWKFSRRPLSNGGNLQNASKNAYCANPVLFFEGCSRVALGMHPCVLSTRLTLFLCWSFHPNVYSSPIEKQKSVFPLVGRHAQLWEPHEWKLSGRGSPIWEWVAWESFIFNLAPPSFR